MNPLPYFVLGAITGALSLIVLRIAIRLAMRKHPTRASTSDLPDDTKEMQECYLLLLKSLRRCARDLDHAQQLLDRAKWGDVKDHFAQRVRHYENLLGGTNDYRTELHRDISNLERELEEWKSIALSETPTQSTTSTQ